MAKSKPGQKAKPAASIVDDSSDPNGMRWMLVHFLEWMRVHHYSERTVDERETHVSYFIKWSEERGILRAGEVTKPILERYQRHLFYYRKADGHPLGVQSQLIRLVSVRMFFKWLTRNNYLLYNPASELELPRAGKRLPKYILTPSEAEQVLNQTDVEDLYGLRDRAILETLYSTGIRRAELANLCVYDVDAERGVVMVRHGKGNKDRVVPIGERALKWVEKYLYSGRPYLSVGQDEGRLFLTRLGEAFGVAGLSELVRRYIKQSGIPKSGSCHLFRHSVATLMLENGADIRYIQQMLGHAKLDTTQIYTQVSIQKLKEIHTATHPAKVRREPKNDEN